MDEQYRKRFGISIRKAEKKRVYVTDPVEEKTNMEEEIITTLKRIAREVDKDPKVAELAEEYQRKYGTLTEEDLRKTFTI